MSKSFKIESYWVKAFVSKEVTDEPYTMTVKIGVFPTELDHKLFANALDTRHPDFKDIEVLDQEYYYFLVDKELEDATELDEGVYIVGDIEYIDTIEFKLQEISDE